MWYTDPAARDKGEPGVYHSFVASVATALNYLGVEIDPAWLMGTSAFAFRIFINEVMCPSATSVFNWASILPETIEQAGRQSVYVSRLWDEEAEALQERIASLMHEIDGRGL